MTLLIINFRGHFTNTYFPASSYHPICRENLRNLSICLSSGTCICIAIFYRAYYHTHTILIVILRNLSSGGMLHRCEPEVRSIFLFPRRSNAV